MQPVEAEQMFGWHRHRFVTIRRSNVRRIYLGEGRWGVGITAVIQCRCGITRTRSEEIPFSGNPLDLTSDEKAWDEGE